MSRWVQPLGSDVGQQSADLTGQADVWDVAYVPAGSRIRLAGARAAVCTAVVSAGTAKIDPRLPFGEESL